MNLKNGCMICGEELVYRDSAAQMECAVCHRTFESNAVCRKGHFVCDECHAKSGAELIIEECRHLKSGDPAEIMRELMRKPFIHMHGPEHHVLAGAALLTAFKNSGGEVDLFEALEEMKRRGEKIPGGTCGFWGCCGAAISAGIFISIVTGATPLAKDEWKLANFVTADALSAIAEKGGPRCCKRDSFLAVEAAVRAVKEHLGIEMGSGSRIKCEFSKLNGQCIGKRCPYNTANDNDI